MNISFIIQSNQALKIVSQTNQLEEALKILQTQSIEMEGVLLDIETAKLVFSKCLEPSLARPYVSSSTHQGIQRVWISDVYYFEADQKYVTVHHKNGTLLIVDTLKNLEVEFSDQFLRINRHLLVNIDEMQSFEKDSQGLYWLKIQHSELALPISRRKISFVRRCLK